MEYSVVSEAGALHQKGAIAREGVFEIAGVARQGIEPKEFIFSSSHFESTVQ